MSVKEMLSPTELLQKISHQNEEMFCFTMFVGIKLYRPEKLWQL